MEGLEIIKEIREYNKALSKLSCSAIERSYIKEFKERDYFYGFSFTLTNLPNDVETFLQSQKYFKGLLKDNHEKLCFYLRHLQEYTCKTNLIRMDVRSSNFAHYNQKIVNAIGAFYLFYGSSMNLKDLIYGSYRQLFYNFDFSAIIATELLQDNLEVVQLCKDVLTSENNTAFLTRDVIIAIEQSRHEQLQKLLMQVFLAAKLQEGLRQSIIETIDENNFTYFLEMIDVIAQENLLRYSSVQRGILTWIGIGYLEAKEKDVRYIFEHLQEYFNHETIRQAALTSANPLNCYLALYCKGATSLETAILEANELIKSKSRHIVASALVYLKATDCFNIEEHANFMDEFEDDEWIMALYYSECNSQKVAESFLCKEMAINLFNHIERFVSTMKTRQLYHSKGFEWFSLELNKHSLCLTLFEILKKYPLTELIDKFMPYVAANLNYDNLDYFMEICFCKASEQIKLSFMIKEIISNNDRLAKKIENELKKSKLDEETILKLEARLKTKKAAARVHIINVLVNQEEAVVKASYQRLLVSSSKTIKESALEMKKKVPQYFNEAAPAEVMIIGKEAGFGLYKRKSIYPLEYQTRLKITTKGLFKKTQFADFSEILPWRKEQVLDYLKKWDQRIKIHENDEYYNGYEYRQIKDNAFWPLDYHQESLEALPLSHVWRQYFDEDNLSIDQVFEIMYLLATIEDEINILDYLEINTNLFTLNHSDVKTINYYQHFTKIFSYYFKEFDSTNYFERVRAYLELLAKYPRDYYYHTLNYNGKKQYHTLVYLHSSMFMTDLLNLNKVSNDDFKQSFTIIWQLYDTYNLKVMDKIENKMTIQPLILARAVVCGLIPIEALYEGILDTHSDNSNSGNHLFEAYRDAYFEGRGWSGKVNFDLDNYHHLNYAYDKEVYIVLREALDLIADKLIIMEATRLNEETAITKYVKDLKVIRGVKYLIIALRVLAGEKIKRQEYGNDRNTIFANVIRNSYPLSTDIPAMLAAEKFSEETLVEVAMLAPQWIDFINQVLKWHGFKEACYYFIAHMRQYDYDQKKATIAKYTQIDPIDLNDGAFDIDWCKEVYQQLGETHFKMIYNASKFLCDNSFHSRARKYADACLKKISKADLLKQITEKRNKDALNAYCVYPLNDEHDLLERYQVIQQFLKESKKFGAQRQASEKRVCEIALINLARNSKYKTPTRLLWMMESEIFTQNAHLLKPQRIGEVEMWLEIDEQGKNKIIITKKGKRQKSIPAALKKDERVILLKDIHNKWNEQYRRSKQMLEQAMMEETYFSLTEIMTIMSNPIVALMLSKLVLVNGNNFGFYDQGALKTLTDKVVLKGQIKIAHPYDLYKNHIWTDFQKLLFEQKMIQPFKQVFRELYLKLDDELDNAESKRYTGYQIQSKKAIATLKSRQWNISYESGLERVYYHDDLVVNLYAEADWFSPSDIEAPSIDYICFSSRKNGQPKLIKEINSIIFSETMRDLDLAVSIAYVGGVDPVTSFSTIELRRTIVEYTCKLMKLANVTVQEHFANIKGSINDYSVHLGSGVIHQNSGGTINLVTVVSGKRGKVYLPFLDEDFKTAEIISKVIMLAEDNKIKDPSILKQIVSRKMEV